MKCFIGAGLLAATLLLGCSDERDPAPPPVADAGGSTDVAADEGGTIRDVSVDVPRSDGYIDLFDVFPLPDAGCPNCIRDRCGAQINACFNNPACGAGLLCTLQMCAGGLLGEGGTTSPTNLLCVLGCFNGDQATAFMAIGSITCLTMTCGSVCNFLDAGVAVDARPPNPDATADVSVDGAVPDTGSDVTGPDTTDIDANAPDASTPDASAPDASTPDASAPDAGLDGDDNDADGGPTDDGASSDIPVETSTPGDPDGGTDATSDPTFPDDAGTD